jgi:hypothetical protein
VSLDQHDKLIALFRTVAGSQGLATRDSDYLDPDRAIAIALRFRGEDLEAIVGVVGDCLVIQVPDLGQLPGTEVDDSVAHAIAAANFSQGLYHFGLDPTDGEVRLFVASAIPPEPGRDLVDTMLLHLEAGLQMYEAVLRIMDPSPRDRTTEFAPAD